jgi:flagellin
LHSTAFLIGALINIYPFKGKDMQVNTNIPALVAANAINLATQQAAQASQRISTSMRVNSSADDPGLMSVINSTKAKIASWSKANDNISSSSAMLTSMNSSLSSVADLLTKMRALAVTSASANTDAQAAANQTAFATYMAQINNIAASSKWNGIGLLNSTSGSNGDPGTVVIQTGIDVGNQMTVNLYNATTAKLGDVATPLSAQALTTATTAASAITQIDKAITTISSYQTTVGATQNVMANQSGFNTSMSTASNTAYANLTGADIAAETANLAAAQIRQNSASAMLAQSSQMTKDMVTTLLKQFVN